MRIAVKVIPGAKKSEVIKESEIKASLHENCDGAFKVKVNQVAEDGKANEAVVRALADYFGVKKSAVKIIAGEKSRNKVVEVLVGNY